MSAELDVYRAIVDAQDTGRVAVAATVVATRGSVPRRAGSRMVICLEDGTLIGTIGGGCGEGDVIAAAPEVAREGRPRLLRVELTDPIDSWSPAVCGGVMEVLLEPVFPTQAGVVTRDQGRRAAPVDSRR